MNTRTGRLYAFAFIFVIALFAVSLYGVTVAIAWARDLPNRIVIDEAAASTAVRSFVIESYHHVLRDGEAATQVEVIRDQLIPYAESDADAAEWIHAEYGDDIRELASSDDPDIASMAAELLESLNAGIQAAPRPTGD